MSTGTLRVTSALGHDAFGVSHLNGESPMYYAFMIAESVKWMQIQNADWS